MPEPNTVTQKRNRMRACMVGAFIAVAALLGIIWIVVDNSSQANLKEQKRQSEDNLKKILAAIEAYIGTHKKLPPSVVYDQQGRPLHSWRVLILPFLGEERLYARFRLNEPWDSAHNAQLLAAMPRVYAPPRAGSSDLYHTYYQGFDGYWDSSKSDSPFWRKVASETPNFLSGEQRTFFVSDRRLQLQQAFPVQNQDKWVLSGDRLNSRMFSLFSDCYVLAEAAEAVPWTKPMDLRYHPDHPLPRLGGIFRDGFHAAYFDAGVEFVAFSNADEAKIRSKIAATRIDAEGDW